MFFIDFSSRCSQRDEGRVVADLQLSGGDAQGVRRTKFASGLQAVRACRMIAARPAIRGRVCDQTRRLDELVAVRP
jgi:hypothetical protein